MGSSTKDAVGAEIGTTLGGQDCLQEGRAPGNVRLPLISRLQISRRTLVSLVLLLSFSAFLDAVVAVNASLTVDEPTHVGYGQLVLHGNPNRRLPYDSQMPISALNAAPLEIASYLEARHMLRPLSGDINLVLVRLATILATLTLGLLVFLWAYNLYGEGPALASCLLCTLSPNLMAHGTLATTDMYHAVGVVGSLYFLRRFLLQPTWRHAVVAGFALALAQITKSFALVLYVVAFVAIATVVLRRRSPRQLTAKRVLLFAAIATLWLVAVLNVAFSFNRTFAPLSSYSIPRLQRMPLLGHIPVPFPYPFLQGLVLMRQSEESGRSFGNIYLLGELRNSRDPDVRGFKSYYAVAYLYKEPIPLQILFFWGLVWVCRNRKLEDFLTGEGLLLFAAAILFVWFSFFSRAQIGIRHILPLLAIETVIAGAAFSKVTSKAWPQKALLCILVLWLAGSVASYYPQMIPYMNEWVRDRRLSYRILADSNLDWGQDAAIVSDFLQNNHDVIFEPKAPVAGRILLGANELSGVYACGSAPSFGKRYRPVATVGYGHFLFDVPAHDRTAGEAPGR